MCNREDFFRFLRFLAVGVGNTLIDIICFFILTWCGIYYLAAQIVAYSVGVINSFYCNRVWTFRVTSRSKVQVIRFLIINLLSLGLSSLLILLCYDVCHQSLWLSKIIATCGGTLLNYIGADLWVFSQNRLEIFHQ